MLGLFQEAVTEWGWLSASELIAEERVGGENRLSKTTAVRSLVAGMSKVALICQYTGGNQGRFITGKSVFSQRIERLWVDVRHGSVDKYIRGSECSPT